MRKIIFFDPVSGRPWLTEDLPVDYESGVPVSHYSPVIYHRNNQTYLAISPLPTASKIPSRRLIAVTESHHVLSDPSPEIRDTSMVVKARVALKGGSLKPVGFRVAGSLTLVSDCFELPCDSPLRYGSFGSPDIEVVVPADLLLGNSDGLAHQYARLSPEALKPESGDSLSVESASSRMCRIVAEVAYNFRYPFIERVSPWTHLGGQRTNVRAAYWKDLSGAKPQYVCAGTSEDGGLADRLTSLLGGEGFSVSKAARRAEAQISEAAAQSGQALWTVGAKGDDRAPRRAWSPRV